MFAGAESEEDLDGVHIVRAGSQHTVHLRAFLRYFKRLRARFDLVIDEVNTIPFFTPVWADIPRFMLIYQLAREVWWYESPFPVSVFGFVLEPLYLRLYRRVAVFTESVSTERDLRRLGFRGPIAVIPVSVEPVDEELVELSAIPTFLYVGRLTPSKRVGDIIRAFSKFRLKAYAGRLWLIGEGPPGYVSALRLLVQQLDLTDSVSFLGRLSLEEKHQRMAQAHSLLMASVREGWGLVVTEANACGTPAIVYDVPGLRDSVRHEETGLVVPASVGSLADGMMRLWTDRGLRQRLSRAGLQWSHDFSSGQAASAVLEYLEGSVAGPFTGTVTSQPRLGQTSPGGHVAALPRKESNP
jgi:glycosyltransferase involved in cell wall biosynthesis